MATKKSNVTSAAKPEDKEKLKTAESEVKATATASSSAKKAATKTTATSAKKTNSTGAKKTATAKTTSAGTKKTSSSTKSTSTGAKKTSTAKTTSAGTAKTSSSTKSTSTGVKKTAPEMEKAVTSEPSEITAENAATANVSESVEQAVVAEVTATVSEPQETATEFEEEKSDETPNTVPVADAETGDAVSDTQVSEEQKNIFVSESEKSDEGGFAVEEPVEKNKFKKIISRIKSWYAGKFRNKHYISRKESKRISKENMRTMRSFEKRKKRRVSPEEYTTQMRDSRNIVEFENLHTYFYTDAGVVKAVNGVSFDIPQSSTVGVVGESGCGKSVTSLSLMQLVQAPQGQIADGSIRFKSLDYKLDGSGKPIPIWEYELDENGNEALDENGNKKILTRAKTDKKGNVVLDKFGNPIMENVQKTGSSGVLLFEMEEKAYDIAKMPVRDMNKIRGRQISMIFQEPMTSLNPVLTIGNQLDEVSLLHLPGATKQIAKAKSLEMLNLVGIAMPERVYKSYPHELSGGMRQRVMIAMALACNPRLIIADEPTTALDVTIQAQVLDLLRDIKHKIDGSIMLITHDLGVIAEMADFVVVMYAGRIVEMGTVEEIFDNPLHPYTVGLQKSKPSMNSEGERLFNIPGNVPNPINMPEYCYFRERCSRSCEACAQKFPDMVSVSPTHKVACYLYGKEGTNGKQ